MKKIVIAAANGFLGRELVSYFHNSNYKVIALCRTLKVIPNATCFVWDGQTIGEWAKELEGATALINLAGKSVDCRYNQKNREAILASRLQSTKVLGKAVAACQKPPLVWLNASSATIYRHAEDKDMDENGGEVGEGFSVEVCKEWEKAFFDSNTPATRKAALRMALVMGSEGGVWPVFSKLAKAGLGGSMGKGQQYVSWIHIADFCRAIEWLIEKPIEGVVNICAPTPLPNALFMKAVREVYKVPFGLRLTHGMLKAGAFFMGTETELVLKSRRVIPQVLMQSGFVFAYATAKDAMQNLVKKPAMFVF